MKIRRIVDILLTICLMLQMSMQITEQEFHEYSGMLMFVLFLVHQFLNRRWYGALFKGKYTLLRSFSTLINFSLLISFVLTAFSGIIISEKFQALNIEELTSFARLAHLCCAYLSFVLMGIHLGLHWGMIAGKIKAIGPAVLAIIIAGYGLYAFVSVNNIFSYIFLQNQFAFIDYEKNSLLVIAENISMFAFWTLTGYQASKFLTGKFLRPGVIFASVFVFFAILRVSLGVPDTMSF